MSTLPRIAAFTQCYQEHVMLPLWVKHYSKLVGRENLLILDHGNEPALSIDNIRIETIPRTHFDEEERVLLIQSWQKKLLKHYDWVIFTDTDEFIILRQPSDVSLNQYLASNPLPATRRCIGVDIIDPGQVPPVDWSKPILSQRSQGIITRWSCKPAISSVPTQWTPGFHQSQSPSNFDPNLWLIHLKYADESHLMQRLALTRSLKWSDASLKKRFGMSHRVPDQAMTIHLNNYRAKLAKENSNNYTNTRNKISINHSPSLNIPPDLIPLL